MKKLIIIFLCILIAAIGITIFLQTQKAEMSLEDILPQRPLVYMRLNDVERSLKQMASMPSWKAINSINYDLLAQKNIILPQHKIFIDIIRTQFSQVLDNPITKKLFGRDVVFAAYPLNQDIEALVHEMKIFNPQLVEEILSGVFLVTRVDPDVQFVEYLSRAFRQYGANVSQGEFEYKGEIIRTIRLSNVGIKFSFVRFNDILVFGIGEKPARLSVDILKGDKPSLAQDPQFIKARATFQTPSMMSGLLDFEAFKELLRGQIRGFAALAGKESEAKEVQGQWEGAFAKMSGLKTFTFSSQLKPIIRFDTHFLIDRAGLNPEYASLYTCPPQVNKTIDFVPKDVLGYQWSNCFELGYYWREMKKELAKTKTGPANISELEEKMGVSIEKDILPAFGDELGGYVSDIQLGGIFPIPKFLFFIEIKDKAKTEKLLAKLKDQPIAILQDENYNGVPMKYLALPLGADLQPGYCFLENYLLIASSSQLLKDSIDASRKAALSLPANPAFKQVDFGLTGRNRSVQFVQVGKVIEKIKGVIGWSNSWMTVREQKMQAFKMGSEKPLEEVKANIVVTEDELQGMRDRIISLEDQIWNLEVNGEDATAVQAQMNDLKSQIKTKELELVDAHERQRELETILQENVENAPDPALRQTFLDEAVYPVLESLKSIKSYGLRVTLDEDVFKSSAFLKLSN